MPRDENGVGHRLDPDRHVDRRARRGHDGRTGDLPDERGRLLPELPTLGEVERRITRCDNELADLVEDHFSAAEAAASAEADWKGHRDRMLLKVANAREGDLLLQAVSKSSDLREAYAKGERVNGEDLKDPTTGEDLYRVYKILEAREKSIDRSLRALQTRLTGLMSVAKGIRGVT